MTQRGSQSLESPNIAERVKFWEEQDKINQELIPRVIRQNELLTSHIADHENLPLIAGNAISEALADVRAEQRQQHEAEIAEVRAEAAEQSRQHQTELAAAKAEREEQSRQHQAELAAAKAEREEQSRQHQAELAAAKAEREEQSRQHSNEVATLQEQLRKAKTLLTGVAAGAVVVAVAALVVGIVL